MASWKVDKSFIVPQGPLYVEYIFVQDVTSDSSDPQTDSNSVTLSSKLANPVWVSAEVLNSATSADQAVATFDDSNGDPINSAARTDSDTKNILVVHSGEADANILVKVYGNAQVE